MGGQIRLLIDIDVQAANIELAAAFYLSPVINTNSTLEEEHLYHTAVIYSVLWSYVLKKNEVLVAHAVFADLLSNLVALNSVGM